MGYGTCCWIAPPQAHGEILLLGLQVVAREQPRVVADVDVDPGQPLLHVLVERYVLHVVVTIGHRRVGVGQRKEIEQPPSVRIDQIGRNPSVHEIRGYRVHVAVAEPRDRRRVAEVPLAHRRGRHPGLECAGIELLAVELVPGEKEHAVPVLVEVRTRDDQRPADVEPRIGELVLRLVLGPRHRAEPVQQPLVGIHPVVAQIQIRRATEFPATGLADRVDRDRALGVLRRVVRLQNLELSDHVGIGVHRRCAVTAGVGGMGAVDDDVERVDAGAVAREIADGALLATIAVAVDPDDLAVEPGTVAGPVRGRRHAGQQLEQLGRGPADHRHVLNLFRRQARALLAGIERGDLGPGDDRHRFAQGPHLQPDAGDRTALAQAELDVGRFPGIEVLQLDLDGVGARRNRREHENSFRVRRRSLNGSRGLIGQDDIGAGKRAPLVVSHEAGDRPGKALRTACRAGERQEEPEHQD